jgi:hypothetical protein
MQKAVWPNQYGCEVHDKHVCTSWESNSDLPARSLVAILIYLARLHDALKLITNVFESFHWYISRISFPHLLSCVLGSLLYLI